MTSRRKAYNGWLLHPAHWGHSGSSGYRTGIFCPLTSSARSGGLVAARLESSLCWFLGGLGLAHAGFCLSSRKKKKKKVVCGDLVEKFLSRVVVLSEEDRPDITALVDWA